jgi:hypothetical protein
MGRAWTSEDAARRLLFLFVGRKPGDTLHISDISQRLGTAGGAFSDILSAISYAQSCKWIRFDGEVVELLAAGFEQPLELPIDGEFLARRE